MSNDPKTTRRDFLRAGLVAIAGAGLTLDTARGECPAVEPVPGSEIDLRGHLQVSSISTDPDPPDFVDIVANERVAGRLSGELKRLGYARTASYPKRNRCGPRFVHTVIVMGWKLPPADGAW